MSPVSGSASSASSISGRAFSRGYFLLAAATALATFALLVLGTALRVSKSGAGCGPGDAGYQAWPLCDGRVSPLLDGAVTVEHLNRALSASVFAGIALLVIGALWRHREQRNVISALVAALALAVFQAALGVAAFETGVTPWIVTASLAAAMILLVLLFYVTRAARQTPQRASAGPASEAAPEAVGRPTRWLAVAVCVTVLAAVLSGGYASAMERYGTPGHARAAGADIACGGSFPECRGELLPFGKFGRDADVQLAHRALSYLAAGLILLALIVSLARRRNRRTVLGAALAMTSVVTVEVLLGALGVWLGAEPWLIVAHLVGATALWLLSVEVLLRASPAKEERIIIRRATPFPEREAAALSR